MPDPSADAKRDRSRRAVWLMVAATLAFAGMSAGVKLLREAGLSTQEVVFWRSAPGLLWIVPTLWLRGIDVRPRELRPVVARCAFGLLAMTGNFYAARELALVQHSSIFLTQPIFVAMLAPLLLSEALERRTAVALCLALTGAAVTVGPWNADAAGPWTAFAAALGGALAAALAAISVRKATRTEHPDLVVFHFAASLTLWSVAWTIPRGELLSLPQGADPVAVATAIGLVAMFGVIGQMLLSRAYESAPASVVAIAGYTAIPLSAALDALVWGRPPGLDSIAGGALVFAAAWTLSRPRARPRDAPDQAAHSA